MFLAKYPGWISIHVACDNRVTTGMNNFSYCWYAINKPTVIQQVENEESANGINNST